MIETPVLYVTVMEEISSVARCPAMGNVHTLTNRLDNAVENVNVCHSFVFFNFIDFYDFTHAHHFPDHRKAEMKSYT